MATRLCTLPNFNECTIRGETGCCEVTRTATACPSLYSLCQHEGEQYHEEALYLQEVGYGFGCCPIGFSCLPRPSCIAYIEVQPSVFTTTQAVMSVSVLVIPVTITVDGTTYVVTEVTSGGEETTLETVHLPGTDVETTSTEVEHKSTQGPIIIDPTLSTWITETATETMIFSVPTDYSSDVPFSMPVPEDSDSITVITISTGGRYTTDLPKLNLGLPEQENEQNSQAGGPISSGGSGLSKGAMAAIVVVSTLVGILVIAMSIRIWLQRKQRKDAWPPHFQDLDHLGSSELGSNGPNSVSPNAGNHVPAMAVDDLLISPTEEVPVYKAELSATPVPMELAGEGRTGAYPEMLQYFPRPVGYPIEVLPVHLPLEAHGSSKAESVPEIFNSKSHHRLPGDVSYQSQLFNLREDSNSGEKVLQKACR
ncbi:hypothetical protein BDZ91DRAFT_826743 [Kalaharituber pfeilii]|nr:hypothetical protein BDZ91DRAFT_826743 [Kalaharituber pfeilii]